MKLLESLISFIAPDNCIGCGDEGSLLCEGCFASEIVSPSPCCYLCGAYSVGSETCTKCRKTSGLSAVWVASSYELLPRELIHQYKFSSRRGASKCMIGYMSGLVPNHPFLVTHVPTSPGRIRERGFDQAALLAKQLAKKKGFRYCPLLVRSKNVHQVGSTRSQRKKQIKDAFRCVNTYLIRRKDILIVDDVMTTGASVEEAARMLKAAGARHVYAVVFAR